MSGPTWTASRTGDVVEVFPHGRKRSERSAREWVESGTTMLRTGETLGEVVPRDYVSLGYWAFRVVPPVVLTLDEVRDGTGFPKGTRFLVIPSRKGE